MLRAPKLLILLLLTRWVQDECATLNSPRHMGLIILVTIEYSPWITQVENGIDPRFTI